MKSIILALGMMFSVVAGAAQPESIEISAFSPKEFLSYNFGTVPVHSRSVVRYNLRNTGATPLTFRSSYVFGADFSAVHSCRNGLLPGERCQFEVAYWPVFAGMASGRFTLEFNEDDIVLDLWGNAR